MITRARLGLLAATAVTLMLVARADAAPVIETWAADGPDDTAAIAAAPLGGRYASADSFEDTVEVRDIHQNLLRIITRAEIVSFFPWMSLDGGPDGVSAMAWSDSGRLLFIMVHDDSTPGDGLGSDGVLRYDAFTNQLNRMFRTELFGSGSEWPHLSAAHFKGRLFIGESTGVVREYAAMRNQASANSINTAAALPDGGPVRGLAVDRLSQVLYAASPSAIYRADLSVAIPNFVSVGSIADIRALAYSDHFGGTGQSGLFVLSSNGTNSTIRLVPPGQALGAQAFNPTIYLNSDTNWHDLAATADGALLIGADEDALRVTDTSDTRLTYDEWLLDELDQHVRFAKGLIAPDGEPAGWVIDADVDAGGTRFHPATPDGAAWVVFLLLVNDEINNDPQAQALVRTVLQRYAGLAPDRIAPSRSADGFFQHWIDPLTGNNKPGWPAEFATYSTMKIVLAAARARDFYPDDPVIQNAAGAIICGVNNWDAYIQPGSLGVHLRSIPAGGPDTSVTNFPFVEGMLFVEEAAAYGGAFSANAYAQWLIPSLWPQTQFLTGQPITGSTPGSFHPAFISLYSLLLQSDFRALSAWRAHINNLRASSAAWTDDNGPRWYTVFSAGTTKSEWGGYHADSLSSHPGNIAAFTSLLGFGGTGDTTEAVAGYNAYRRGARQVFDTGAHMLYRRSSVDPGYEPNSAALPDVTIGALGLAELIQPGVIGAVLARPLPDSAPCACGQSPPLADLSGDGLVGIDDLNQILANWSQSVGIGSEIDLAGDDGVIDISDLNVVLAAWGSGCM